MNKIIEYVIANKSEELRKELSEKLASRLEFKLSANLYHRINDLRQKAVKQLMEDCKPIIEQFIVDSGFENQLEIAAGEVFEEITKDIKLNILDNLKGSTL